MINFIIQISDDALMEMSLAALEAYVIPEQKIGNKSKKIKTELETYGLLWGHEIFLPDGDILYSVQKLTVDAMAYRREDAVWPSEGLNVIKDMITSYWPQYSFLGDFHSHPFEHYKEVEEINGHYFSEQDRVSIIENKQNDDDFRVALVLTISSLKKSSNTNPVNINNSTICWTFNNYRFWLNACLVYKDYSDNEDDGLISILPNSPHWKKQYEHEDVNEVYLHCPYLNAPWQATRFGRKAGKGKHLTGNV